MFYVYYHRDPTTNEIRYVGKGSGRRAKQLSNRHARHKQWLSKLKSEGLKPIVQILEHFESEEDAYIREKELIKKEREGGADLCNVTEGGEGAAGLVGHLNPMYGKKRPDFVRWMKNNPDRLNDNKRTARAVKCNETGEVYESTIAAAEALGVNESTVYKHLRGNYPTVKGRTFAYKNGSGYQRKKIDAKKNERPVRCLELNKIFGSPLRAAHELKLDVSAIYKVLRGRFKSTKGYTFVWS